MHSNMNMSICNRTPKIISLIFVIKFALHLYHTEVRVFFESGSVSVAEDDGSVTLCIRTVGVAAQSFSVQVATRNLNPVDATGRFKTNTVISTI